jgi:uncharacterized protein
MGPEMMLDRAREFLAQKRIALVGVSRDEKDFSRMVLRELLRRGYDVAPISRSLAEIEDRPCHSRLQEVQPHVAGALILTPSSRTEEVVRDCIAAGIRRVWMHRGGGPGAASPAAVELCKANVIELVTDLCPFMVLPDAAWPHRVHGFFRRAALRRRSRRERAPRT